MAKPQPWKNFPVFVEEQVRWRDLDAYNHVTNSVYFNFFEEARIALFNKVAIFRRADKNNPEFGTTLVKTEAEYKSQAFLGDRLMIAAAFTAVRRIFLDTEYSIFNKKTGILVAKGMASNVLINRESFKPLRVPTEIAAEIGKFTR